MRLPRFTISACRRAKCLVDEVDSVLAVRLRQALDKYQIEATSLVVGGPGREVWDFYERAADHWLGAARNARGAHSRTSRKRRTSPNSAASMPCRRTAVSSRKIRMTRFTRNHHRDARSRALLQNATARIFVTNRAGDAHRPRPRHSRRSDWDNQGVEFRPCKT